MVSNPDQAQVAERGETLEITPEKLLTLDDKMEQASFCYDRGDDLLVTNRLAQRLGREVDIRAAVSTIEGPFGVICIKTHGNLYSYKIVCRRLENGLLYGRIGMDYLYYMIQTFLYAGHRVRSQLQMVLGFLDFFTAKTPDEETLLEAAQRNANQAILAVTRMGDTLGPLGECEMSVVALRDVMHNVLQEAKKFNISVEIDDDLLIYVDPSLIATAILNLVSNADRHAGDGVEISVRSKVVENEVVISVEDNGCGIAPEKLEHLFTPYTSRVQEGDCLGIGLFITRRIVEMMGGRIWVESEVGSGTTFSFSLPLATELPEFLDYDDVPKARPSKV